MKPTLATGARGEARRRINSEHLLSFHDASLPPVLATPWMLYIMEHAAFNAIAPHLDDDEQSVGVGFEFEHLAPTPAGHTVVATAEITVIDGNRVTLAFEARDDEDLIGRGTHVRAVVKLERFRRFLSRKVR